MARFSKDKTATAVRAEWWDAEEEVLLRPRKTWRMEMRAQQKAVQLPEGMTPEALQALPQAQAFRMLAEAQDATIMQQALLEQMIVSWTFKYDDGDLVPLNTETIDELSPEDATFLLSEIDRRGENYLAEEPLPLTDADFREPGEVPVDGEVPGSGPSGD